MDLRLKFGMSKTEKTANTCIIITEVAIDDQTTVLGALADSVQEVVDLEPEHIESAPRIGTRLNTVFIKGMGKRGNSFVIILDIEKSLFEGRTGAGSADRREVEYRRRIELQVNNM